MTLETENTVLTYFFKKSLFGMVLHVRITSKDNPRASTVTKCDEELALKFLLSIRNKE